MNSAEYDNPELFAELKKTPLVAWPTLALIVVCLSVIGLSWYLVLTQGMPLWAGFIVNTIAYYYLFSPIHDGSHHSLSSNKKLNDFLNAVAYLPMSFLANNVHVPRVGHMQHHIHTGKKDLDPDLAISSKGIHALGPWFFWGSQYFAYFKKYANRLPRLKTGRFHKTRVIVTLVLAITLIVNFPMQALFLWLLPVSFGLTWMTAFVFSYLPHHIHQRVEGKDPLDPFQSTCNILGYEWILNPLMQYQNYHQMHHLYPTVPFYRMEKIWKANYTEHMKHQPALIDLRTHSS